MSLLLLISLTVLALEVQGFPTGCWPTSCFKPRKHSLASETTLDDYLYVPASAVDRLLLSRSKSNSPASSLPKWFLALSPRHIVRFTLPPKPLANNAPQKISSLPHAVPSEAKTTTKENIASLSKDIDADDAVKSQSWRYVHLGEQDIVELAKASLRLQNVLRVQKILKEAQLKHKISITSFLHEILPPFAPTIDDLPQEIWTICGADKEGDAIFVSRQGERYVVDAGVVTDWVIDRLGDHPLAKLDGHPNIPVDDSSVIDTQCKGAKESEERKDKFENAAPVSFLDIE